MEEEKQKTVPTVLLLVVVLSLMLSSALLGILIYRSRVRPPRPRQEAPADQALIREMIGQLQKAVERRTVCAERLKTLAPMIVNHAALNGGVWPEDYTKVVEGALPVCPECVIATGGDVRRASYLFLKPDKPPTQVDPLRPLLMDPVPVHPGQMYQVALKNGTVEEVPDEEIAGYLKRWSIAVPGITDRSATEAPESR